MALSLTSNIPKLHPADSRKLQITGIESTIIASGSYEVTINVADKERVFKIRPRPDLSLKTDLSSHLVRLIDSKLNINTSSIQAFSNLLYLVQVTVKSLNENDAVIDTENISFYTFNGVEQQYDHFFDEDYITWLTVNFEHRAKWLSTWNGERKIDFDSVSYLNKFYGSFGLISDQEFSGIQVTAFQNDGTTKFLTIPYSGTMEPAILQVCVSPKSFNEFIPNFIDQDTKYFEVVDIDNLMEVVRYKLEVESIVRKTHNFLYVNQLGMIDAFNFTKAHSKRLNISKDVIEKGYDRRSFNTRVNEEFAVVSDWLSHQNSDSLEDLFISPKVKLYQDTRVIDLTVPPTPQAARAENITSTNVKIEWGGAPNVKGYDVYLNDVKQNVNYITDWYYYIHYLNEGTTYNIKVVAVGLNNIESLAAEFDFTTTLIIDEPIPLIVTHNIEALFPTNRVIEINFDQPMVHANDSELTANNFQYSWANQITSTEVECIVNVSADKQTITLTMSGNDQFGLMDGENYYFTMSNLKSVDQTIGANDFYIDHQIAGYTEDNAPAIVIQTEQYGETITPQDPEIDNPPTVVYDAPVYEREEDFREVILTVKNIEIHPRLTKLKQYEVTFEYAQKYKSQRQ